jgi:hypothetical protein
MVVRLNQARVLFIINFDVIKGPIIFNEMRLAFEISYIAQLYMQCIFYLSVDGKCKLQNSLTCA